jgi:hypothetical protein
MGLDITVLAVDWERLEGTPRDERPKLLLVCPPATVSAPAARWAGAEPLLETLREWAVVAGEAERRGWGLLGLPM